MATKNFMTLTIDGIDVSKYSEYYVLNHITKKSEPKRSDAFTMTNINEIVQIEVPEIHVKFKYISIELYREIFKATRKTEFRIDYYDQDYDMIRSNMFYLKNPTSLKPHAWGGKYYGFKEFELSFVCTMNPISTLTIELLNNKAELLIKPYYVVVNKNEANTLELNVITKLDNINIASSVEISFSNDLLSLSGAFTEKKDGNVYIVNTSSLNTLIIIDVSKIKYAGEYIMYLSVKDKEYGSSTISCIIKVGT